MEVLIEALERQLYRDPCEVLIAIESRTCAGCIYQREALSTKYCGLSKRYGKRCKSYREVENGES